MRTYDDVVEVRREHAAPRQFLWRGRVYVVLDVLSHWYERSAWWEGAQARATLGTDGHGDDPRGGGGIGGEREVWRVQARAGRCSGDGVFDLAVSTGVTTGPSAWRLLRVVD